MKKIIFLILMVFLVFSLTVTASDGWYSRTSEDAMEGTVRRFAYSPRVSSINKMDFPYGDTTAQMSIGFDGEDEWAYLIFSSEPNIPNSTLKDGYNVIDTRIKWDDGEVENVTLTQSWGSKILHFSNYSRNISKILESSEKVLLELNWYGEGMVHFEIPLNGSNEIIKEIRESF